MSFEREPELSADEVETLVAETIESNEVALFMKGTPLMPQCGYSRTALQLIEQHREDVETVDVLQALDHFRVALEEHSGWTTIPQVFVDGEFVGGSDVLSQLHEQGDLAESLSA